jgi:membrane-associated phospholipid phosphatase
MNASRPSVTRKGVAFAFALVAQLTNPSTARSAPPVPAGAPDKTRLEGAPVEVTLPVAQTLPPETSPHPRRWDGKTSHSTPWDYSLAGVGVASIVAQEVFLQPIRPPLRWDGPILFDKAVRAALRTDAIASTEEDVSWVLWGLQLGYPVLVDVPLVWARHDPRLAKDLFWQDAVTLTLAGGFDLGLRDIVGRARPHTYDCLAQGGGQHCLDQVESTRSFPGGHMINATAASVLTCTQHVYNRLYGGPWDGLTCALTLTSDVTLGVLRIMSDNHWPTDQVAGAILGALIGWGVPYVMHYHHPGPDTAGDGAPAVPVATTSIVLPAPIGVPGGAGLGLVGLF